MVQSLNTKIDLVVNATSYQGLTDYGKIMIGDKGFEFYNERDANKFIQIPWEEVDYVIASVMFKGKKIPRYAIQTKKNGTFSFSSKKPKESYGSLTGIFRCNKTRDHTNLQALTKKILDTGQGQVLCFFCCDDKNIEKKDFSSLAQTSVPKLYIHFIESGYPRSYDKYVNEIILYYFSRRKKKWKLLDKKVDLRQKSSVSEVTCQGW